MAEVPTSHTPAPVGATSARADNRALIGIGYMLFGVAGMAGMDAFAKWLGQSYSVVEIMFFRNLFGLLPALAFAWQAGGLKVLRIASLKGQALRALLVMVAMGSFFWALKSVPLAEALAIAFAAPLFITALSRPLLGEPVGPRRWVAVLIGFAGVLIMLRPGIEAFQPAALLVLLAALCYALVMLITRRLSRLESSPSMVFWSSFATVLVTAFILPFEWRSPDTLSLALFAGMGLLGGVSMFCLTQAYRHAEAAVVAPFDYMALLWGILIGWLVWGELPEPLVYLGAAVVVASGLYILHREAKLARSQR